MHQYNENLFSNRQIFQRVHKLPRHVVLWIENHNDVLEGIYDLLRDSIESHPYILDKLDYPSFCACVARLSSVDSPTTRQGLAGGRFLVHDFINESKVSLADTEVKSIFDANDQNDNDDASDSCEQ